MSRVVRAASLAAPVFLLLACGGRPKAPRAANDAAHVVTAVPAPVVEDPTARLKRSCDAGEWDDCIALGKADPSHAREAFAKTCAGPVYSNDGCAWFVHASNAQNDGADTAAVKKAAKIGCSTLGVTPDNRDVRAEACVAAGSLRDACELGNQPACEKQRQIAADNEKAAASHGPDDVEGANLSVPSMNVDGLVLKDLACRTEGGAMGGLFGGITVGVGFKAKKSKLDACSPKATVETRVKWTGAGGRMTAVRASGSDAAVTKCVERALTGAVSTTSGVCAASVTHGKK